MGSAKMMLEHLEKAPLKVVKGSTGEIQDTCPFEAKQLWRDRGAVVMAVRRPGCALCRRGAAELSTLKQQLDDLNVSLYAVVHEDFGVGEFQPFFQGQVFLDENRHFYGMKERKMFWSGLVRPSVWKNIYQSSKQGYAGNFSGEGRILGAVYVIGKGEDGIYFEHQEAVFGDHPDLSKVMDGVKEMVKNKASPESTEEKNNTRL